MINIDLDDVVLTLACPNCGFTQGVVMLGSLSVEGSQNCPKCYEHCVITACGINSAKVAELPLPTEFIEKTKGE